MRSLQLPSSRGPEALARVVQVPEIQVTDLRPLDRDQAHHGARLDRPCVSAPDWHDVVVNAATVLGPACNPRVEVAIEIEAPRHVGVAVEVHRAIVIRNVRGCGAAPSRGMLPPCVSTSRPGASR